MTFDPGVSVLLGAAGLAIGTLSSLLGVGGGIFIVPLLTLTALVGTVQEAAGTSLAAITFTSLSATIAYARRRTIDVRAGLTLMPTSLVGAWAGARLTSVIASRWLAVGFAVLLLYPIVMMLRGKTTSEIGHGHRGPATGARLVVIGAAIGLVAGLASGLLGIGSGTIMVPSLALFLGLDILPAIATSLFVMVPSSAFAAFTHFQQGNLHVELAPPLIVGTVIGAQLGPFLGERISRRRLRQLFGVVLLYAAVNMVLKALG
ncbi:MAG: sulfite exporter TauE/SafE family protein [Candidatus Bipolaricaulota bacterium]|nr:sulfite exporter TauE/SafE family protein [Candidatus Bipolaricaulota bacterium]